MSSLGYEYTMYDEDDDGNKALVAFIIGLLIGGLLIWAFSGPCPEGKVTEEFTPRVDRAEDACLTQGGIPIYDNQEKLSDCKKL